MNDVTHWQKSKYVSNELIWLVWLNHYMYYYYIIPKFLTIIMKLISFQNGKKNTCTFYVWSVTFKGFRRRFQLHNTNFYVKWELLMIIMASRLSNAMQCNENLYLFNHQWAINAILAIPVTVVYFFLPHKSPDDGTLVLFAYVQIIRSFLTGHFSSFESRIAIIS